MIKNVIKKLVPSSLMQWRRRKIADEVQQKFAGKSVAETFKEIYEKNIWGGARGEFFSGEGSSEKYSLKYAEAIKIFITKNNVKSVVDLGCGDFRVAAKFVSNEFYYTGCDVVPALIEHLKKTYANEKIQFRSVNIVEDELPEGDLCLIRQVLQHLSNAEIEKVLQKAGKYKYLIVTEHYPSPNAEFEPNLDIPHGPQARTYYNSAVVLDKPPFKLQNIKLLLDVEAEEGTRIKTFVIEN